jgi:peptide/nickel transport system permease protein
VAQFGLDVGVLIGGAVITETVVGLPGIGYTAIRAINQQDLPVVIGASAGVIVANLLVDILTPYSTPESACTRRGF